MKRYYYHLCLLIVSCFPAGNSGVQAQGSNPPVNLGADLVSRYVWRGLDYGSSPSIQPYLEFNTGNLTLGAWGAYRTNNAGIQEVDLYANYTLAGMFTVGVTDYFFPDENQGSDYFDYAQDYQHVLETTFSFNGTENLPLTFMAGVNLVNDPDHSLYFELGYSLSFLDLFLGAGNGIYTLEDPAEDDRFGIVNAGLTAGKKIKVTENFSLPVSASLITNPQARGIYLVIGISL